MIRRSGCAIPLPRTLTPGGAWSALSHLNMLYGLDDDGGPPLRYTRVHEFSEPVYRQNFHGGTAVANLGDSPAEMVLEHPYYDLCNTVVLALTVPPYSVEILRDGPQEQPGRP